MSDVNVWTGSGRIGSDPELKHIGDKAKLEFRLANTQKWNGGERTSWLTVGMWGKRGEALSRHLAKGQQVFVSGELEVRTYEKRDGGKGIAVEIRAHQIEFGKDAKGGPRSSGPSDFSDGSKGFPEDGFGDEIIPFAPLRLLYGPEVP